MAGGPLPHMGQIVGKLYLGQKLVRDLYMLFHDLPLLFRQSPPADGKHGQFLLLNPRVGRPLLVQPLLLPQPGQRRQLLIGQISGGIDLLHQRFRPAGLIRERRAFPGGNLAGKHPDPAVQPNQLHPMEKRTVLGRRQSGHLVHDLQRRHQLADVMEPHAHQQFLLLLRGERRLPPGAEIVQKG